MSETSTDDDLGPGIPTPPIPLAGRAESVSGYLGNEVVGVPDDVLDRLRGVCSEIHTDATCRAESSRDWWPLAMTWAVEGAVPALAQAVARPATTEEVAAVMAVCEHSRIPLTAAGGRSGVCGGSAPVHGGVVLDLTRLDGIVDVDDTSLLVDVRAGMFGDRFEHTLRTQHGVTAGHWPQSMTLSTVGGWLACRGAGQFSTRYGKIEDMVVGLDVVLASGEMITTGGNARAAAGPDLNQLFVGSEGTLGVITGARLRLHPAPTHEVRAAFSFESFEAGLDACRRILRRGATPAVLRLYDAVEGDRNFSTGDAVHPLLVLDEGDPTMIDAVMQVVADECADAGSLDDSLVEQWMGHRNDVSALEKLISGGLVVDTMEITGPWSALPGIYEAALEAIGGVEGTLAASAHQSHAYVDGACLYFTFAGRPPPEAKDDFYRRVWDAGTMAVLRRGGSLSHHHGVGLNRGRFMAEALGGAFDTLVTIKEALDPTGILNPGKLGLPSPFGEARWP